MSRQIAAWEKEYRQAGTVRIESSYTLRPERCVLWFRDFLARRSQRTGLVLDLGCGRGRNALPFLQAGWSVAGLDVVSEALRDFRRRARGLPGRLRAVRGDLSRPLAFTTAVFDAVMEITAADNLTAARVRDRFWREAARVLKPGGWLLSYHFTPADGYYGPLLRASARRRQGLLYDPRAGMYFRFYGRRTIAAAARGRLKLYQVRHYRYPGPMFGKIYMRDLNAAVFRRTMD